MLKICHDFCWHRSCLQYCSIGLAYFPSEACCYSYGSSRMGFSAFPNLFYISLQESHLGRRSTHFYFVFFQFSVEEVYLVSGSGLKGLHIFSLFLKGVFLIFPSFNIKIISSYLLSRAGKKLFFFWQVILKEISTSVRFFFILTFILSNFLQIPALDIQSTKITFFFEKSC